MLMLARIDGKSPVEYLDSCEQDLVRRFAIDSIQNPLEKMSEWVPRWSRFLDDLEK